MKKIELAVAAALAGVAVSAAAAQDAVQWRVEDGGNGHWYQFVPEHTPWDVSRELALLGGADLACVTGEPENNFIRNLIPLEDAGYLGGIRTQEGWAWVSGEAWRFTNWNPGEPNSSTIGEVVWLGHTSEAATNGWNDHTQASDLQGYLIEWSADCNGDGIVDYGQILDGTYPDENDNGVPDCCDEGIACSSTPIQWRVEDGGNGHWYQRVPWTGDDLLAFNDNLIDQGAHLASIGSSSEQGFVSSLSTDLQYWTMLGGIRDVSIPCGQVSGWSWLDGTTFDFTSWDVGTCPQPDCSVSTAIAFGWDRNGCEPTTRWHDVPPEDIYIRFAIIEWSADCNGDGIVDYGQILDGTYPDENDNGVPDCCDDGIACDCPADITGDGKVDAADIGVLLAVWNTDGGAIPAADINGDGTVNASDLGLVLGAWGLCS